MTNHTPAAIAQRRAAGWLTAREAADMIGIHVQTLKRMEGGPPFYRVTDRGDRRYLVGEVKAWLANHRVEGQPLPGDNRGDGTGSPLR